MQHATIIPSPESLIARAREMQPVLRQRAERCEAERNVPAETIAEMQEAGFFRILQPKRWGGYEMDPQVFYDVQMAIAEACMSTAWVYGVVGCHPYELALFHDQAQQDVWGKDTSVLASSSYQPVGKVEHADGGFYLSGQWGFSSGSKHCDWVLLGAVVPPAKEGDAPDARTFLLPRSDYEILDRWHVFGLKGTGSEDIKVNRVFVPEYRTHRSVDGFLCTNPGQQENTAPLFALPWAQVFVRAVSTAAIGATRGAVAAAVEISKSRISTNTGKAAKADPFLQNAVAKAYAQADEMDVVLHRNFSEMMEFARAGKEIPIEKRALFRYQSATVVRRCVDLVDDLLPLLGGRAIYNDSPIIRYWLNLNAARAHVANDTNNFGPDVTNTLMGEKPGFLFL
jgi:3-hydroxy-9,10-secoandrosta-1,3,5(10)-triene-9,17-dione monooxygenase